MQAISLFFVYALAAARITGLITSDVITDGPRNALLGWLDPADGSVGAFIGKLITCSWCSGVWVCAAVAPLAYYAGERPAVLIPALALAGAQLVGMTSEMGR